MSECASDTLRHGTKTQSQLGQRRILKSLGNSLGVLVLLCPAPILEGVSPLQPDSPGHQLRIAARLKRQVIQSRAGLGPPRSFEHSLVDKWGVIICLMPESSWADDVMIPG